MFAGECFRGNNSGRRCRTCFALRYRFLSTIFTRSESNCFDKSKLDTRSENRALLSESCGVFFVWCFHLEKKELASGLQLHVRQFLWKRLLRRVPLCFFGNYQKLVARQAWCTWHVQFKLEFLQSRSFAEIGDLWCIWLKAGLRWLFWRYFRTSFFP